ncbi:Alg9-like mannosyltransferase family-domain-containing protein [Peziza echinospora]|nr:Alg9-like mannosyltransferase family-domain-containing protein [Peziza echinospora]
MTHEHTIMSSPQPHTPKAFSVELLYVFVLSIRIVNAVSVRTFFQPDEYYQALEPAWRLIFGDGWVTWEWLEKLRSIAHPMLFAMLYKATNELLDLFKITNFVTRGEVLNVAPRLLQAFFATAGDIYTFRLARRILGDEAGWTALFLSMGSAFHWFCSTRTFSNSLETSITIIALYYWPWPTRHVSSEKGARNWAIDAPETDLKLSLSLAAVACILRPTNVLIWASLGAFLLFRATSRAERLHIVSEAAKTGFSALLLNSLLDRRFYGEFTFPPYTFLKFNLLQSLSSFYGRSPWHYYFSQGLPLLMTTYTPLAIHEISSVFEKVSDVLIHNTESRAAALKLLEDQKEGKPITNPTAPPKPIKELSPSLSARLQLSLTVITTIIAYSFIPHKEVRFIYPLLPILIILTSSAVHGIKNISHKTRQRIVIGMVIVNLPIAWYSTQLHQRGVIDVVNYLRRDVDNWHSLGFLMPCHSTPWQSSLQVPSRRGRTMWALTCEPPLHLSTQKEREEYLDEADVFYQNPTKFLEENFPTPPAKGRNPKKRMFEEKRYQWPDRLVFFGVLEREVMRSYLGVGVGNGTEIEIESEKGEEGKTGEGAVVGESESRYTLCHRFFNSHFHDDSRRVGDVVVYCLQTPEEEKAWSA